MSDECAGSGFVYYLLVILHNRSSKPNEGEQGINLYCLSSFTLCSTDFFLTLLDSVMVVKITGQQLLYALENGVSKYPAKEG